MPGCRSIDCLRLLNPTCLLVPRSPSRIDGPTTEVSSPALCEPWVPRHPKPHPVFPRNTLHEAASISPLCFRKPNLLRAAQNGAVVVGSGQSALPAAGIGGADAGWCHPGLDLEGAKEQAMTTLPKRLPFCVPAHPDIRRGRWRLVQHS